MWRCSFIFIASAPWSFVSWRTNYVWASPWDAPFWSALHCATFLLIEKDSQFCQHSFQKDFLSFWDLLSDCSTSYLYCSSAIYAWGTALRPVSFYLYTFKWHCVYFFLFIWILHGVSGTSFRFVFYWAVEGHKPNDRKWRHLQCYLCNLGWSIACEQGSFC